MGVPKLFNSLINQYHHNAATNPTGYYVIKQKIENNYPTHLYLDFNGAIYQCIKPEIKTEDALIAHVVDYLETICHMIPNLEFVYIAMDGIPPMGKVAQQRIRRFHSICKNNRIRKINERFGTELDHSSINEHIDTNMITPGTAFMSNLSIAIRRKCMTFDKWRVVFSDSSIPGEGEHKIIKYIRDLDKDLESDNPVNKVIYALDGDLIFLSLGLHLENVYLFREANEYGNLSALTSHTGKRFLYMDINELERAIITNSQDTYGCSNMTNPDMRRRYIDDYIFLGMLLGNDFMPKCHWFSIAEGGFERLLSAYWQIHNHTETYLTDCQNDRPMLDTEMLSDILFIVKNQETEAINSLFARRKKARIPIKPDMSERERQQTMMDFLPLQYLNIEREIEPHMEGWRARYYKTCFNMIPSPENIRMVCRSYLKTLVWNFHYYFNPDGCISWDWVYDFPYSPTWSDIYDELITHKNVNINVSGSDKLFKFTLGKPLDAQTLLFMVLPWNSRKYMAVEISRKLNDESCPMRIYFPKRYGLNVAFHRYYHECTPILFKMDRYQVEKWLKDCKYSEDELKRNLVGNIFTNRV